MAELGKLAAGLFGFVIMITLKAFVVNKLYYWFVYNEFTNYELSIYQTLGLLTLCSSILIKRSNVNDNSKFGEVFVNTVAFYIITFVIGYIAYNLK